LGAFMVGGRGWRHRRGGMGGVVLCSNRDLLFS
jgi:hypothetical protein